MFNACGNLFVTYFLLRIRGYIAGIAEILRRRIQWAILFVGIFFQVLDLRIIAAPLIEIASDRGSDITSSLALFAFGMFLTQIQRKVILGAPFSAYLAALPIPDTTHWVVDLCVLLVANGVLWFYFVIGTILYCVGVSSQETSGIVVGCLNILFTASVIILGQMYLLRRNRFALSIVLFALLCVISSNRILTGIPYHFVLGLALVICVLLLLRPVASAYRWPKRGGNFSGSLHLKLVHAFDVLIPSWMVIQVQVLAEKPFGTIVSILFAFSATGFGLALVFQGGKIEMAAYIAIVAACFSSLFMSKLFYTLLASHKRFGEYLSTLPITSYFWLVRDWVFLGFITFLVVVPMQAILVIFSGTKYGSIIFVWPVFLSLLLVFRVIIEHSKHQSVLLLTLATGLYIYLLGIVFL